MKLLAAVLLSVFTAFSVSNVKKTANNTYRADKDIVKCTDDSVPCTYNTNALPSHMVIATTDCQHVPADGETAILLTGPEGTTILFSRGGTCKVAAIGGK